MSLVLQWFNQDMLTQHQLNICNLRELKFLVFQLELNSFIIKLNSLILVFIMRQMVMELFFTNQKKLSQFLSKKENQGKN